MLKKIYLISFVFSFSVALTTYVNSSLLDKIFGDFYVGILYIIASVISLTTLGLVPKIVKSIGAYKLIISTLLINVIGSLVLIKSQTQIGNAIGFFMFLPSIPLTYFCLDLFIEHFSKNNSTGKNRGLYLLAINAGWLFAPLIVGKIITSGNFSPVYHFAQIIAFIALILALLFIRRYHDPKYARQSLRQTLIDLNNNKQIKSAIKLNFVLQTFYAFMVIYTPIYLVNYFNLSWSQIGIIFSIMLSAFVIFQYPVGILIDNKKIKNINALLFSLVLMALTLIVFYNLKPSSPVILIGFIIFMTRVGAAIYESSIEYFFFSRSDDSNSNYISLFRDMSPLAYVIAPAIGTLIIKIMPIRNIFIVLAIFMLAAGLLTIKRITTYEKTT